MTDLATHRVYLRAPVRLGLSAMHLAVDWINAHLAQLARSTGVIREPRATADEVTGALLVDMEVLAASPAEALVVAQTAVATAAGAGGVMLGEVLPVSRAALFGARADQAMRRGSPA